MNNKDFGKKSCSQPIDKDKAPEIFLNLQSEGCINGSDLLKTSDGFRMIYKSLSDILLEKDIVDFPVFRYCVVSAGSYWSRMEPSPFRRYQTGN
jgi:hypothetical protein